ncbi:hypothetical protein [Candidatus Poriferisocius sp.]|uniref:hypothetical protein n=1 Tax=Candidatus Poriferisocius sp. TaxID=3101276 RepID=UPI003B02CEA1
MTPDLIDGEDREQLRHEILRLRDQALGAEVQCQYLRDRVAELEDQVAERDARIAEWKDRVAERDTRIAERDTRIAERDAEILRLRVDLNRPAIIRLARRIARRPLPDA